MTIKNVGMQSDTTRNSVLSTSAQGTVSYTHLAATDTQIRAFLPADREVFITESDLSGPFLQSADALIPEHIPIPSFGDKALKLRMIQTGALSLIHI